MKVELEVLPEAEEEDDDGRDFPYWYIGVPLFAGGIALFVVAYKWAAASQVRYIEKLKSMAPVDAPCLTRGRLGVRNVEIPTACALLLLLVGTLLHC